MNDSQKPLEGATTVTNINVRNGSGLGWAVAVIGWLAGIVLAKGGAAFWATVIPPYGWYLVVERVMQVIGMVGPLL